MTARCDAGTKRATRCGSATRLSAPTRPVLATCLTSAQSRHAHVGSALLGREHAYHARMPQLAEPLVHPVFPSKPHIVGPVGAVCGWFLDPPGGIIQFVKPVKGTSELASWLVGPAFDALDARFPDCAHLTLILDLTHMVGRSAAARSILLHSAKALGGRFSRVFVVPPADYPPMYLQAFQASIAFVRLLGMSVTVAGSTASVLDRYGLAAAE